MVRRNKRRRVQQEWHTYVREVMGTDTQTEAARKTGLPQTTISRWLDPHDSHLRRTAGNVRTFAEGYGQSVLGAFVAAGLLTPEEAGYRDKVDISVVSNEDLAAELQHRLQTRPQSANNG